MISYQNDQSLTTMTGVYKHKKTTPRPLTTILGYNLQLKNSIAA